MSVKIFCQFRYLNTDDFASESVSNTHIADYPTSDLPNQNLFLKFVMVIQKSLVLVGDPNSLSACVVLSDM